VKLSDGARLSDLLKIACVRGCRFGWGGGLPTATTTKTPKPRSTPAMFFNASPCKALESRFLPFC